MSQYAHPLTHNEARCDKMILNLDFDKINHNKNNFFFQDEFIFSPLISFKYLLIIFSSSIIQLFSAMAIFH
jgi:hypothetical protein